MLNSMIRKRLWGRICGLATLGIAMVLGVSNAQPTEPAGRWYAGDTHMHGHGCDGDRGPQQLMSLMTGADLTVGSALVWGAGYRDDMSYFTGRDAPGSTPERILHYDLEVSGFPSDLMGHIVALGLKEIQFPRRLYSLPIAQWAIDQGAAVGMAHAMAWSSNYQFPELGRTCCVPYEFPIDLALGKMHFLETEVLATEHDSASQIAHAPGFQFLWTTLLNSGFKVPITGASDFPCIPKVLDKTSVRTYVWIDGPLTYADWLEGIRQGRTVIATGANDFLTMTVNGALIGSEVQLPAGGDPVDIVIDASLGTPGTVELVMNGEVLAAESVSTESGQRFKKTLLITKSSWIAARAPKVQTGAIYVLVGDQPIRASARDAQYYVEYIDYLIAQMDAGRFARHDINSTELQRELQEAKARYLEARQLFAQRAQEAQAQAINTVSTQLPTIKRYGVFEETFPIDSSRYSNPWEDVDLTVTFITPSGRSVAIGGFYYQPNTWKVRVAPWEVGRWSWTAIARDRSRAILEQSGEFEVVESNEPGFVRRHSGNPFRLVFENGRLFPAIGLGDCILDSDHSGSPLDNWGLDGGFRETGQHEAGRGVDMDTYFSTYGSAGFNLFRWSVDNCSFKLWDEISPSGNRYLEREGQWGDELVAKLREHGFRVYMVIFGFEPPFAQDAQDPEKMDAVKRYVKYVVDRYGAYVDFWELMNEATADNAWYTIVANYLRSIDPYGHLISTSWEKPEHPAIEITSPHWYQKEGEYDSDTVTAHRIENWKGFNKPIIFGEQGNTGQNWDERSALRMRLRSWSAFFNEGVLIFWNTSGFRDYRNESAANLYLGPEERGYVRALQEFVRDLDPDVKRVSVNVSNPSRVRAYGLRSENAFTAYLHNFTDHNNPTTDITLTVDSPSSGEVIWYSPTTGQVIQIASVSVGMQTLRVPPFVVDIALKVRGSQQAGTRSTQQGATVRYVLSSSQKICQLTGEFDRQRQQPTLNRTKSRFGVVGTDLGSSFEHQGRIYFLFGDTIGERREGSPSDDSIAYSEDTNPEDCVALNFVTGPDGRYLSPRIPGIRLRAFEVPTGGFSSNGVMYVFFTTDHSEQRVMGRSILARSTNNAQSFQYLYDVSRDKFINIAPVIVNNSDILGLPAREGQGLLLWGSGTYRRSDPYLAYIPLSSVEDRGTLSYFSGLTAEGSPHWSTSEAEAMSLFTHPCIGELSVAWNPFLRQWLMLYNCGNPRGINFRVADQPWGPWSETQTLFHPWEDDGYCHFMHVSWQFRNCDSVHDPERQNVWGGEYGPYMIPRYFTGDGTRTTIYYVMSTWNPYNVVLMRSELQLGVEP